MNNKILDLLYEIGNDELLNQHVENASKWLQKAISLLELSTPSQLDPDASDMRLNVLHTYGT